MAMGYNEYGDWGYIPDDQVDPAAPVDQRNISFNPAPVAPAGLPALGATPDFANMPGLGFGGFGGFGLPGTGQPSAPVSTTPTPNPTPAPTPTPAPDSYNPVLSNNSIDKDFIKSIDKSIPLDSFNINDYIIDNGSSGETGGMPTSISSVTKDIGHDLLAAYNPNTGKLEGIQPKSKFLGGTWSPEGKFLPFQNEGWSLGSFLSGGVRGVSDLLSSDAVKTLAPMIISGGLGGGAGVGNMLGIGSTAGGALVGAGTAALAGGDPLKGALMGGIGGSSGVQIGETGYSVGDALKAFNAAKVISGGDPLAIAKLGVGYANGFTGNGPSSSDMTEGYFAPGGEGYIAPEEPQEAPATVPTQAEQQPAVDNFIQQIEQYQAPEPTVEQIMATEPTNQAEIDQQTQDLLSSLSGGTDNGTSDNGVSTNEQAEWDVPVAPSELQTALDDLPQEQAEWDVPVNPDDLNTALTEIAAPEPNDTPSPTEQDVLDFMKEHPEDATNKTTVPKIPTSKKTKTSKSTSAADVIKAAADKAAKDKAAADKAAKDKANAEAAAYAKAQQDQYNALLAMMSGKNDVAHIKSNTSLFGALPGTEPPAPSAQQTYADPVAALEGMDQQYAIGGHVDDFDVDALLHILRS